MIWSYTHQFPWPDHYRSCPYSPHLKEWLQHGRLTPCNQGSPWTIYTAREISWKSKQQRSYNKQNEEYSFARKFPSKKILHVNTSCKKTDSPQQTKLRIIFMLWNSFVKAIFISLKKSLLFSSQVLHVLVHYKAHWEGSSLTCPALTTASVWLD